MRADIGAASLSIYGDPFDLDPFVDHEEEEQEAHVTSLLEAKRRGISRSALRSHQPVARPVSAGLSSRRSVDLPRSVGIVEAAPVPDLLGSILSGQSMLLMDSSDVVINRDGSLKTAKPMVPNAPMPNTRTFSQSSSSGEANIAVSPGFSSFHHNENLPGSSHTSTLSHNSSHLPSLANHIQPTPPNLPTKGSPSFPPLRPNVPILSPGHRETSEGVQRETTSSSVQPNQDSDFKSKGVAPSQTKKDPVKPTWVDVSVLPRIPKIKRESSNGASHGSDRVGSEKGSTSNGSGFPESSMSSLSGDKGKQQKGHTSGQAQKSRPERTSSSSSAFSNSFSSPSSSSSSSGTSASQSRHASFSSSSSVSFRINSSGNSWQARRLNMTSSSSGSNVWEQWKDEEQDAKKKRLRKDKQKLLAFRNTFSEESDDNNIYDPFNPTLSESSNSGDEAESPRLRHRTQSSPRERKSSVLENTNGSDMSEADPVQLKTETRETEVSQEEPGCARMSVSQERAFSEDCVKVKQESELADVNTETVFFYNTFKKEPSSDESDGNESESYDDGRVKKESEIKTDVKDTEAPARQSFDQLTTEQKVEDERAEHLGRSPFNYRDDSSASTSTTTKKKQREETKTESTSCSKHPIKDLGHKKPTYKGSKEQQSSRFETDAGRREDHHGTDKGGKKKERDKDRNSRRSRSRERRRVRSTSDSSQSSSPDRTRRKRRQSRSRSADKTRKRRSRSPSSSSSRERSRRKKHQQTSRKRSDHRERDSDRRRVSKDIRRGRSHSRSRSRSRERRKDISRSQQMSVSSRDKVESPSKSRKKRRTRSRSRERRKEERSSRSSAKMSDTCGSSSRDAALSQDGKQKSNVPGNTGDAKCAEGNKQELVAVSFLSEVKKEELDYDSESQIVPTGDPNEIKNEIKNEKEAKKEKPVDIFEDYFTPEAIKREETDTTSLVTSEFIDDVMEDPSKTEYGEMIEPEPDPVPLSPLAPTFSPTADLLPDTASQPGLGDPSKQNPDCSTEVSVKQEPSDSDDDFNVDMMLDSLDYVNPEQTEGSGAAVKEEKEAVKVEEEQVPTVVGSKSKTQVKRVTWNIQEPEGPQPEKSPSKLALYKRKLKQEGSRKPSLAVQTTNQDIVSDPSQKSTALLSTSSGSGDLQPRESSTTGQGEAEEGDFSRKDKQYLKKLHMLERAVEEVKLAIKPFYQNRDINKEEYKEILRKAVQKVCHSKSGEINPVKVGNLIKAYVEKYKHARKHKKGDDSAKAPEEQTEAMKMSESP